MAIFKKRLPVLPQSPETGIKVNDWGMQLAKPPLSYTSQDGPSNLATRTLFASSHSSLLPSSTDSTAESELIYGYAPIEPERELSVGQVAELVEACALVVAERGLEVPLILSTMQLDTQESTTVTLIRGWLLGDRRVWMEDLHLAEPTACAAMIKWSLCRLVNVKGERGFLYWNDYVEWKKSERDAGHIPRAFEVLSSKLSHEAARLLNALLNLFIRVAAHSGKNGMTPRKLASLFSPYFFGLPDDESFDKTYAEWQARTDATEHIIISFIRNQQVIEGRIPTHLETFIADYPHQLGIFELEGSRIHRGGRVESVIRVQRISRFHSRNLIASAPTWTVPNSENWSLFQPSSSISSSSSLSTLTNLTPHYTPNYRHLLNISSLDQDDDGEIQRYKSTVDKEWSKFGLEGFSNVDTKQLDFDLTEGERKRVKSRPETMQWGTFADSGFLNRESYLPQDLGFHELAEKVTLWPDATRALQDRLKATEDGLPEFKYDTTAREVRSVMVDEYFFEAWADVLVSGGWARDELKESSWVLIQLRARSREGESARMRYSNSGETRTEARWVLAESLVPREYRDNLRDGKVKKSLKRISFMRSVRRNLKNDKVVASPTSLQSPPRSSPAQSAPTSTPSRNSPARVNLSSGGKDVTPGTTHDTFSPLSLSNPSRSQSSTSLSTPLSTPNSDSNGSPSMTQRMKALGNRLKLGKNSTVSSASPSPKSVERLFITGDDRGAKAREVYEEDRSGAATGLNRNGSIASSNWVHVMTREVPRSERNLVASPSEESVVLPSLPQKLTSSHSSRIPPPASPMRNASSDTVPSSGDVYDGLDEDAEEISPQEVSTGVPFSTGKDREYGSGRRTPTTPTRSQPRRAEIEEQRSDRLREDVHDLSRAEYGHETGDTNGKRESYQNWDQQVRLSAYGLERHPSPPPPEHRLGEIAEEY